MASPTVSALVRGPGAQQGAIALRRRRRSPVSIAVGALLAGVMGMSLLVAVILGGAQPAATCGAGAVAVTPAGGWRGRRGAVRRAAGAGARSGV